MGSLVSREILRGIPLVAGYELTEAGHDVTILEAQLRPGGRVQTIREPFSDGLYAEAGAARIPDNHDLTLHYVKHFGLALVPFYPKKLDMVYLIGGKRIKCRSWTDVDLSQVPLNLTDISGRRPTIANSATPSAWRATWHKRSLEEWRLRSPVQNAPDL